MGFDVKRSSVLKRSSAREKTNKREAGSRGRCGPLPNNASRVFHGGATNVDAGYFHACIRRVLESAARAQRPSHTAKFSRRRSPRGPDFSGWNCVAARLPRPTIEANATPQYSVVHTTSAGSAGAG